MSRQRWGAYASVVAGIGIAVAGLEGCASGPVSPDGYANWNRYSASPAVMRSDAPVPISKLNYNEAGMVFVYGKVGEVCQKKGCWFLLVDGDREIRVKFKDYAFFVPMNAEGHTAVVEGWGNVNVLDVEWARHLAKEAGKPQSEIDAITEPVPTYEIEATAVYVSGSGLSEPFNPETNG